MVPLGPVYNRPTGVTGVPAGWDLAASAEHVIIRAKRSLRTPTAPAIQPFNVTPFSRSWSLLDSGSTVQARGLVAKFNVADIPAGELEVVIIAENRREFIYTIKVEQRGLID